VIGRGRVLAVGASTHVRGDSLALDEVLHRAGGEPHLDLAPREAVGDAVEAALDLDVVLDPDPAHAPFGEDVGLARQRLERRPSELPEAAAAGSPRAGDRELPPDQAPGSGRAGPGAIGGSRLRERRPGVVACLGGQGGARPAAA